MQNLNGYYVHRAGQYKCATYSSLMLHGHVSLAPCALLSSTSLKYERECEG